MLKQEPPRRPFGWQYTEQPVERPGKAVVEPAPAPLHNKTIGRLTNEIAGLEGEFIPLDPDTKPELSKPAERTSEDKP